MSDRLSWHPPRLIANPYYRHGLLVLALLYLIWSLGTLEINWGRLSDGMSRAADIFSRMVPPDFARWKLLLRGLLESLQMALAASFVGMFLAIPMGLCAARNLVPRSVYLIGRGILAITRTFHEIIIAILFVKIFGFGPLAGVLTLVVATMSFIGKMLAEDIENLKPGQMEAIRATGATFPRMLLYAIQPQVLPRFIGVTIYRLDANIRHSTVVGIVGAGGIGQTLAASFSRYDYDFSLAILLAIISLVFLGELLSNWVRAKLR